MRHILTPLAISLTLAASTPAAAEATTMWFQTTQNIERLLVTRTTTSDGKAYSEAGCWGNWNYGVKRQNHRWWFHRLGCNAWDDLGRKFHLDITVTGAFTFRGIEMWCNDSQADGYCPRYANAYLKRS